MTIRLSTGTRNGLASSLGFQGMFNAGHMEIYTGGQPTNADSAITGTTLGIVSVASALLTKETRATGTITITGATAGSIANITVGGLNIIPDGAINWVSGDTANTIAQKLSDAINRNGMFEAAAASAVVTIKGRPGTGVTTAALAGSLTTITATYVAMAGGVAPANGLVLLPPVAGVVAKNTSIWSCTGITAGTAGWFRLYGSDTADTGALLSAAPYYPRIDGSCGVGSGDAQLSSLTFANGTPSTVDVFSFTIPAA